MRPSLMSPGAVDCKMKTKKQSWYLSNKQMNTLVMKLTIFISDRLTDGDALEDVLVMF